MTPAGCWLSKIRLDPRIISRPAAFVGSDHAALMDAADGVDARSHTAVAPKLCDFPQSGSRVGDLDPVRIKKKAYNRHKFRHFKRLGGRTRRKFELRTNLKATLRAPGTYINSTHRHAHRSRV